MLKEFVLVFLFGFGVICDDSEPTQMSSCDLNCPEGMIKDDFNCSCFAESNDSTEFCDIVCPEDHIKDSQLCICNTQNLCNIQCPEETSIDLNKCLCENNPEPTKSCDLVCDRKNFQLDAERCTCYCKC